MADNEIVNGTAVIFVRKLSRFSCRFSCLQGEIINFDGKEFLNLDFGRVFHPTFTLNHSEKQEINSESLNHAIPSPATTNYL